VGMCEGNWREGAGEVGSWVFLYTLASQFLITSD
jgi:hypothetical protein